MCGYERLSAREYEFLFHAVDRSAGQGLRADHARLSDLAACNVLRCLFNLYVRVLHHALEAGAFDDGHAFLTDGRRNLSGAL